MAQSELLAAPRAEFRATGTMASASRAPAASASAVRKAGQAIGPADMGGEAGIEHAGAGQPAPQQHEQGDRHPARRGMADQDGQAAR